MAATLPEVLLSAVQDANDLVSWAAPNADVTQDERCEKRMFQALMCPVPAELSVGVPLLRFWNLSIEAQPLVQAMLDDRKTSTASCERCGYADPGEHCLWIPIGVSVVALHFCTHCRNELDTAFAHTLVWR